MFSGRKFAFLSDPTVQSLEEGEDFNGTASAGGRAEKKKKKKKKKQQGDGSSEVSAGPLREGNLLQTAKECSENVPQSHGPQERKQDSKQDRDLVEFSESELLSVGSGPNTTGTAREEPHNEVKVKAKVTAGKKKKKKNNKNRGILPSDVSLTLPKPTKKEGKNVQTREERSVKEEAVSNVPPLQEEKRSDLERFSNETTLLSGEEKERQNLSQVLTLMYGVGLTALRKLFMDINPNWSNTPGDALNLDKGLMKLKGRELACFNDGNINKWDVSLITTVLLHSKKCKDEISKRPGFEDAICRIKDYKNKLLSHASDDKMSDTDYQSRWPEISRHLETVGASKEDIEMVLDGNILENGKMYRDLFLAEVASHSATQAVVIEEMRQMNKSVHEKLDIVIAKQFSSETESKTQLSPQHGGPDWDAWMKFLDSMHSFDYSQNNYILITDEMAPELMEHFSIFRSVPWKVVLDFDSLSEEKGMYQDFASKDGVGSLINMITPAEIRRLSIANLPRHIDANKTQWMFVNGRKSDGSDGGPQELEDWKDTSVKEILTFFRCCSEPDKFDKNKPVVCLILPFKEETVPFINTTIKRLVQNFNEFDLNFVRIMPEGLSCPLPDKLVKKINLCTTDLDPQLLRLGMKKLFQVSSEQSYHMPTSQANVPANLTHKEYLYLKEYLDLLYEGCEDLSSMIDEDDEKKVEDLIEEHRRSFMSGNWISFVSLNYNHDAKREISNDVRTHIQRLLDQGLTHSTIVEISHSPGSGGSTIARRVMWDLHKSYPCVFAKLEDHRYDLEDDSLFLDSLADRISTVQEICYTTPVVLLDGKHTGIETLSNRLARILSSKGKRAVLLRCNHSFVEDKKAQSFPSEFSDVHATFSVNVRLEQSKADLKEFEAKYKDDIKKCNEITSLSSLSRVFHFPLFAMLEEFRNKLQEIICESIDEMTSREKEIVIVVAFIQKYAAQAIPAPLLYAIFKPSIQVCQKDSLRHDLQGVTYENISTLMIERLWNLMVPANPAKFIYLGKGFKRPNYFHEMYTLQHPVVAEMVLKKAKAALNRDTLAIVHDFLSFPIYEDIRFIPLMKDLFVQSGCGPGKFSVLFEELKATHPNEAGEVFYEAAEKTKDVVVVTSAARFYAKVPQLSFAKAKELILKAFECRNAKEKQRTIHDVNGNVLLKEMRTLSKQGRINSLQKLEEFADKTLNSFRKARTFPPTFPNPLIGEVKTWLTCIDWITKNQCDGDSQKALQFITSNDAPSFFRTCVSESFNLLNIVDEIVKSVSTLPDPCTTQREANSVRLSLMQTFKMDRISAAEGRSDIDIIKACRALCSVDKFPASSELELKRLQVQYIFSSRRSIETINKKGLEYLLDLLTELVEAEKDAVFAKHLMKISILISGYSLEKGIAVCSIWSRNSSYDPLPYFYEMVIYFLKILDGDILDHKAKFHDALEICRKKSEQNCRKSMSTHYLGKTGTGMACLMTKNTLFRGETEYKSCSNNEAAETYWKTKSRKKLRECCGRIRTHTSSSGKKNHLTIELLEGSIELYVAKSAGIGGADRDFVPGSKVYFVVSFNLLGPVANGITFSPWLPREQSLGET